MFSLSLHFSPSLFRSLSKQKMEAGLPMLNCLLQHTLRSLCTSSDPSPSSKWVYAVFWKILPRNYPPPKWDFGGGALDRAKGNKRNWILVWEDGFCDFQECERAERGDIKARFGADVFFKMSHEVYSYGEGLVGKVAADNSHKWVFKDSPTESDPAFITSWNVSIDPQPRAWQVQFHSGIQTIAIVSVREGLIQLGSFYKIVEDLNLIISIQRKFSYLQSIPGIYAVQRPYVPTQNPYTLKPNNTHFLIEANETTFDEYRQLAGAKRPPGENPGESPPKSINLGFNNPRNSTAGVAGAPPPMWSIPPLLPNVPCTLGALLSKIPPYNNAIEAPETPPLMAKSSIIRSMDRTVKVEPSYVLEEKPISLNPNLVLGDGVTVGLGFGPLRQGQGALNLN